MKQVQVQRKPVKSGTQVTDAPTVRKDIAKKWFAES